MPSKEKKFSAKALVIAVIISLAVGYAISTLFYLDTSLAPTSTITTDNNSYSESLFQENSDFAIEGVPSYIEKTVVEFDENGNVITQQIYWNTGQVTHYTP